MDFIIVKAEVFRIVRNHQDKPKRMIMYMIKEHLPDIAFNRIQKALKELSK